MIPTEVTSNSFLRSKSIKLKERLSHLWHIISELHIFYYERCLSSWFKMIDELIVCLTIESQRCGSGRFDRYTAGLNQAMVSADCVTV